MNQTTWEKPHERDQRHVVSFFNFAIQAKKGYE
jgi:hypothetical protein